VAQHGGTQRQAIKHGQSVAAQLGGSGEQQHFHHSSRAVQFARHHKSIAAIVALAANYGDAVGMAILLQDELRHRGPGVLHQDDGLHSEARGGNAIDLAHLVGAGDFHARSVAKSSSRRRPSGSPMAMRWSPEWMISSGAGLKRMCESSPLMASTMTPISWRMREASRD